MPEVVYGGRLGGCVRPSIVVADHNGAVYHNWTHHPVVVIIARKQN